MRSSTHKTLRVCPCSRQRKRVGSKSSVSNQCERVTLSETSLTQMSQFSQGLTLFRPQLRNSNVRIRYTKRKFTEDVLSAPQTVFCSLAETTNYSLLSTVLCVLPSSVGSMCTSPTRPIRWFPFILNELYRGFPTKRSCLIRLSSGVSVV